MHPHQTVRTDAQDLTNIAQKCGADAQHEDRTDLDRTELVLRSLDDCVHGVRDGEGVRPVVVGNVAVVLAHRQREAEQVVQVEPEAMCRE